MRFPESGLASIRCLKIKMKWLSLLVIFFACTSLLVAQVKKPEPPLKQPQFETSRQVLVVTTRGWSEHTGIGRLFERKGPRSPWISAGKAFDVVVGRNGLAWGDSDSPSRSITKQKFEGDGNAPAGRFPILQAFGSGPKAQGIESSYVKLDEYTECVDDVTSAFYNRIANRLQVGNFDWRSSEKMLAVGPEYELGLFVGYNSFPVARGRGSCIFLHIWKDAESGTSGCTAMERSNLDKLASWLDPAKIPFLVQLPDNEYRIYSKTWKLPNLK